MLLTIERIAEAIYADTAQLYQPLSPSLSSPKPVELRVNKAELDRKRAAQRIAPSISYMLENLNKPLRISMLCSVARISHSYFFVLFKSATGHSPLDFFIRLRMRRAGELLRSTTLNVKEIAAVLGYSEPFYFSRLFKAVNGVSPSDYRTMTAGSSEIKNAAALLRPKGASAKPPGAQHANAQLCHPAACAQTGARNGDATSMLSSYQSPPSRPIRTRSLN